MKTIIKVSGIIALAAVMVFSMTACAGAPAAVEAAIAANPNGVAFGANGGDFNGQASVNIDGTAGAALGSLPMPPLRAGYQFIGYNTAADRSGTAFDADTPIQLGMVVHAQWTRNDHKAGISGLVLRHSFDNVTAATSDRAEPVYPENAAENLIAEARGNYGNVPPFGSRTINGNTYWFYRSGQPRRMDSPEVTYLFLGEGFGELLKSNDWSIAFYVRIPQDYNYDAPNAHGHMIMAFADSNNLQRETGQGMWVRQQADGYFQWSTSVAGWENPNNRGGNAGSPGRWVHLTFIRESSTWRILYNGNQVNAGTIDLHPSEMEDLVFNTLAGAPFRSDSVQANTLFADFRFYQRRLSDSEARSLADSLSDLNSRNIEW